MRPILYILILSCVLHINCKKLNLASVNIEGFVLTDNLGNQYGTHGSTADDWKISDWNSLTVFEQTFLGFNDNINMSNTAVSSVMAYPAYPSPVTNYSSIYFTASDSVKLKVALVNRSGQVLHTLAIKFKGAQNLQFDCSDAGKFPPGIDLRYYYSFSSTAQQHFKVGYGDIKKCKVSSFTISNWQDCF